MEDGHIYAASQLATQEEDFNQANREEFLKTLHVGMTIFTFTSWQGKPVSISEIIITDFDDSIIHYETHDGLYRSHHHIGDILNPWHGVCLTRERAELVQKAREIAFDNSEELQAKFLADEEASRLFFDAIDDIGFDDDDDYYEDDDQDSRHIVHHTTIGRN